MQDEITSLGAEPSGAAEWRRHYPVVAAAAAGMSLSAVAVYSVGTIIVPMSRELGWSRALISSGPMVTSVVQVCLSAAVGVMIDRLGARRIAIAAASLLCIALASLSTVGDNPLRWWVLWGVIGIAASSTPTVWTAPIGALFEKRRGLALAIVLSGTGFASTLVPPLTGFAVTEFGWRTSYLLLGCVWGLIVVPLIVLFFRNGREPGVAARRAPGEGISASGGGLSARDGFRSATFYKIALPTLGGSLVTTTLTLNIVPILSSTQIPLAVAASIAGAVGMATMSGRIIGGFFLDRLDARWIAAISSLGGLVIISAIVAAPGSTSVAFVAVIAFGLLMGPKIAAVVYLATRHFDQRSFGVLFGAIQAMLGLGTGLGPFVANMIFDNTGSYDLFLFISVPILLACAAVYLTLPPLGSAAPAPAPERQPI